MVIPLVTGLVGRDGRDLPLTLADGTKIERGVLVLDKAAQSFVFTGVAERPVLSINRNFSAPIRLTANLSADDLRLLAAHDSDPFNRWQAVQTLASALLVGNVARLRAGQDPEVDEGLLDALAAILADKTLEPAFVAEALSPPSEADIAREIGRDVDPDAIFRARAALRALIGLHLNAALTATYREPRRQRPLQPGRRQRRPARCSRTSASICSPRRRSRTPFALAAKQYQAADNMTDRMAALGDARRCTTCPERTGRVRRFLPALPATIR